MKSSSSDSQAVCKTNRAPATQPGNACRVLALATGRESAVALDQASEKLLLHRDTISPHRSKPDHTKSSKQEPPESCPQGFPCRTDPTLKTHPGSASSNSRNTTPLSNVSRTHRNR